MCLLARRGQRAGKGYSARWQGVVSKLAKATQQMCKESAMNSVTEFVTDWWFNYLF